MILKGLKALFGMPIAKSGTTRLFLSKPSLNLIWDDPHSRWQVKISKELEEWLLDYPNAWRVGIDDDTGRRWIEFNDANVAVLCKLTFK